MEKWLKGLFLAYAVLALIFGIPLFLAPGRFLGLFGWAPVDPLLSRLLGAALLAMAWWSSLGAFQYDPGRAGWLASGNLVFTALGTAGLLRHLIGYHFPFMVWFVCGLLALWAVTWGVVAVSLRRSG
jgi:hypothetical protein